MKVRGVRAGCVHATNLVYILLLLPLTVTRVPADLVLADRPAHLGAASRCPLRTAAHCTTGC